MDGIDGYNFNKQDEIILGSVDLSKNNSFDISKSFKPNGLKLPSDLLIQERHTLKETAKSKKTRFTYGTTDTSTPIEKP